MTGQRPPRHRAHRRADLRAARRTVLRLLTAWDPAGLAACAPDDEYDCLADLVVSRLNAGTDVVSLAAMLRHEVGSHFGVPAAALDTDDVAARLVAWWTTLSPAQQRHKPDSAPLTPPPRPDRDPGPAAAMTPPAVDGYAHLWDGTDPDWVILADSDGCDERGLPFNRRTGMALVICDDDDLAAAVLRAMYHHGLPVISGKSTRGPG